MKKFLTLFYLIAVLFSVSLSAMADTWTYTWDKNKASGGQGFLNPSNKELLSQTAEINGINWTFVSNTYATYFAKNGQQFGTANNPVLHGVLSTSDLSGKIKSVSFDVKKKTAEQDVAVSVQVNGKVYGTSASLTTDVVTYTFTPAEGTEEEGKIEVIFDQKENNTGTIIFIKMTIEYEGDGSSTTTVVDLKDPELDFAVKEVTMYASDEEEPINNPLTNPFNLSPIVYKSSDNTVAVPDKNGDVYSPGKVGEAVIYAVFEGNEEYRVDTASFVV
ncbi:MAG: hypothetical protein J5663_06680 [Bacteroidaceae bacterium]|nr:hypothetical protein [Bacteroidaceae bacterium]